MGIGFREMVVGVIGSSNEGIEVDDAGFEFREELGLVLGEVISRVFDIRLVAENGVGVESSLNRVVPISVF